ncbi:MAG: hypothetical protein R2734_15180 [Nocardioides sp.]
MMPQDRGRRLGLRLKLATLELLERDFERRAIHTWTALDNHAMLRTNTAFGSLSRWRPCTRCSV